MRSLTDSPYPSRLPSTLGTPVARACHGRTTTCRTSSLERRAIQQDVRSELLAPSGQGMAAAEGHGADPTDRTLRGCECRAAQPGGRRGSGMSSVYHIYDFAAFCLPWSALGSALFLPLPIL